MVSPRVLHCSQLNWVALKRGQYLKLAYSYAKCRRVIGEAKKEQTLVPELVPHLFLSMVVLREGPERPLVLDYSSTLISIFFSAAASFLGILISRTPWV